MMAEREKTGFKRGRERHGKLMLSQGEKAKRQKSG
jgi:hypothetical protein